MEQANVLNMSEFRARQLVEDAKYHISVGDLDLAASTFQKSIEFQETAEGLTYLGWVLSLRGHFDEAIDLCHRALAIDCEFGNALNDLGSYLIQKNRYEEALPLLEKAKASRGYEPKHFPFINLGRAYSALGRFDDAIREFKEALKIVPGHHEIESVLRQLEKIQETEN
jgi:tetratricopeptide (TPR) repeat protein